MRKILPPLILTISLGLVYLATLAPGLTWANDGADGGDFITAAATGGIAHPTGYPLYLLAAKLFQLIPIGSLAYRTNLLSAVAAIVGAGLVYALLVYPRDSAVHGSWLAGLTGGFALGLSPVFWSQAVISEVYTLHTALTGLILLLSIREARSAQEGKWLSRLCGLLAGLATGNHLTAVLLLPAVLANNLWQGNRKLDWRAAGRALTWFALGLLVYLTLPLRAATQPVINWGNPVNFSNFAWLISGDLYQSNLLQPSMEQLLERVHAWAYLMVQQFAVPGLALGMIGLVVFFKPTRLFFLSIYTAVIFSVFAILYTTADSYVYLMPVFLAFSVWLGLGLAGLLEMAGKNRRPLEWAAGATLAAMFITLAILRWPQVDASHDLRAEQFADRVLREAPANALVFAAGDRAVFSLWYIHLALKQRPDLTIIASDLMQFDWYADSLRRYYPQVAWPEGLLWSVNILPANPARPVCEVSFFEAANIYCKAPAP